MFFQLMFILFLIIFFVYYIFNNNNPGRVTNFTPKKNFSKEKMTEATIVSLNIICNLDIYTFVALLSTL